MATSGPYKIYFLICKQNISGSHEIMTYDYIFMRLDALKIYVHGCKHNGKSLNSVRIIKGFIEKIFNDSNVWSRNWWQFCDYSLQLLLNEKAEALLQEVEDLVTVPVDRMTSQGSPRSLSQLNDMDIFSHSFSSQWESFDCRKINLVHLRLRWCNFCSSSHSIIYADIRDSFDKNRVL